jgi:hypothetical protein
MLAIVQAKFGMFDTMLLIARPGKTTEIEDVVPHARSPIDSASSFSSHCSLSS